MLNTHSLTNCAFTTSINGTSLASSMSNAKICLTDWGFMTTIKGTPLTTTMLEAFILPGGIHRSDTTFNTAPLTSSVGTAIITLVNRCGITIWDQASSATSMFHTQVGRAPCQLSAMTTATATMARAKIS